MDRDAFMEEVWTVVHCYETQSMLTTGPNRPLLGEILDKLDECERRISEVLIDSTSDENETYSPIKATQQESNEEMIYLSRTQKRTMRSKMVIDKINDMTMKLGSKVTLRKTGKTKVDAEPPTIAVSSAKGKRVEDVVDIGQGDKSQG